MRISLALLAFVAFLVTGCDSAGPVTDAPVPARFEAEATGALTLQLSGSATALDGLSGTGVSFEREGGETSTVFSLNDDASDARIVLIGTTDDPLVVGRYGIGNFQNNGPNARRPFVAALLSGSGESAFSTRGRVDLSEVTETTVSGTFRFTGETFEVIDGQPTRGTTRVTGSFTVDLQQL